MSPRHGKTNCLFSLTCGMLLYALILLPDVTTDIRKVKRDHGEKGLWCKAPMLWRGKWRRDLPGAKAGEAGKFQGMGRKERRIILRMFEKTIRNDDALCLLKITCLYVFPYINKVMPHVVIMLHTKAIDYLIEAPVPNIVVWIRIGPICSYVWIVGPQ